MLQIKRVILLLLIFMLILNFCVYADDNYNVLGTTSNSGGILRYVWIKLKKPIIVKYNKESQESLVDLINKDFFDLNLRLTSETSVDSADINIMFCHFVDKTNKNIILSDLDNNEEIHNKLDNNIIKRRDLFQLRKVNINKNNLGDYEIPKLYMSELKLYDNRITHIGILTNYGVLGIKGNIIINNSPPPKPFLLVNKNFRDDYVFYNITHLNLTFNKNVKSVNCNYAFNINNNFVDIDVGNLKNIDNLNLNIIVVSEEDDKLVLNYNLKVKSITGNSFLDKLIIIVIESINSMKNMWIIITLKAFGVGIIFLLARVTWRYVKRWLNRI